jgi:uncharacterized membrane protein
MLFNVEYLPLFHHFKANYQFPKHIFFFVSVAGFVPDARTFHNIYKLQKHVLLRHQSYLIVFMGSTNLRFWQIISVFFIRGTATTCTTCTGSLENLR